MTTAERILQLPGKISLPNAEADLRMSGDTLNITVSVRDATDSGREPQGRAIWEQDSIEYFFELAPGKFSEKHSKVYTSDTFRLFYSPRAEAGKRLTGWFKPDSAVKLGDISMAEKTTSSGYSVTLKIPAKFFGSSFGFDLKINDAKPGKKADSATAWTTHSERYSDRTVLGEVIIGAGSASAAERKK